MKEKALITGITGQDGSYLAELLLEKGYEVHGIVRRIAFEDAEHRLWRIHHLKDKINLHIASLDNFPSIFRVINAIKPDECYHLAAQSYVANSFDDEFSIMNTNINGTHFLLAAIKDWAPECKLYFAGSSEMFGNPVEMPQKETTSFRPRSSYGISKVAGYHLTRNYREAYGLKAYCGILYNHESPRRGYEFVTRKITSHLARIKAGLTQELRLGNLDAQRDWGHARDYVKAMWKMLQTDNADDYVISTGKPHSVRAFLERAFSYAGLDYNDYVVVDPRFYRLEESTVLTGDYSKAKRVIGWQPTISFEDLVREMVDSDIELIKNNRS